jgi:hypothetical protein
MTEISLVGVSLRSREDDNAAGAKTEPQDTAGPVSARWAEDIHRPLGAGVQAETLTGAARRRPFRLRRQRDPLGEGQPCTWRTLLVKVAG